ncbi:MAG: DUF1883 domain-containing protein [Dehalococcoidia bacterium]
MKFQHYDLGQRRAGEVVEVTLKGTAANVRLLDSSNLQSYRSGRRHRFYGGHVKRSPVRLRIPRPGHWHVAIDLGGYSGTVRSGVQVLPGRLQPLREVPLSSVPSLVQRPHDDVGLPQSGADDREYDVFIAHASEDKEVVARPLAHALQAAGLQVWYDEFELRIGDSLRRKIDRGLASSRFGVVILSQAFFDKGWPNYELDGLVTRAVTGDQILLPIWHKVSKREVMEYSPSLADKLARSTGTHTVEEIAAEIGEVIQGPTEEGTVEGEYREV